MKLSQWAAAVVVVAVSSSWCLAENKARPFSLFRPACLDGGWCDGCCLPKACCPDDYCRKPVPHVPCQSHCCCKDDYCRKPLPHVPCLSSCCCPDDYCPKPCPPCPPHLCQQDYTCGPCETKHCGCPVRLPPVCQKDYTCGPCETAHCGCSVAQPVLCPKNCGPCELHYRNCCPNCASAAPCDCAKPAEDAYVERPYYEE